MPHSQPKRGAAAYSRKEEVEIDGKTGPTDPLGFHLDTVVPL